MYCIICGQTWSYIYLDISKSWQIIVFSVIIIESVAVLQPGVLLLVVAAIQLVLLQGGGVPLAQGALHVLPPPHHRCHGDDDEDHCRCGTCYNYCNIAIWFVFLWFPWWGDGPILIRRWWDNLQFISSTLFVVVDCEIREDLLASPSVGLISKCLFITSALFSLKPLLSSSIHHLCSSAKAWYSYLKWPSS